jgi:hypothetical protein
MAVREADMVRGSCLCGDIIFEVDEAEIAAVVACYCVNCRKVSGAQFGVYFQVRGGGFRWLSGEDKVGTFESSPGNLRGHCCTCGSIAPIKTAYGSVRVPGGALDDDPGLTPDVAIFEASRAKWCGSEAAADRFQDAGPPDFWRSMVARLFSQG